jgi:signal transduction histidine kinase/DNA-binding response OmpR family regulator
MNYPLHTLALAHERDVVSARQRARSVAASLGFDHQDQIRVATAVSELARNAFRYAKGGSVTFSLDTDERVFRVSVVDRGGGIPHLEKVLSGSYRSSTGMGMGILGSKRLMDEFSIESTQTGTTVVFGKHLPVHAPLLDSSAAKRLSAELARQNTTGPIEELQTQNRELLNTLNELRERKQELLQMNAELQDTNRGVVALYAELDERADYLRRVSELKSSFLSNMSHEFRTPLNSMLALTRMLLDRMDGELTGEQEQQVRFIQRSAKELAEMVDDLLDLAKVEAGRLEVKPKSFEIADLFGALRGMLKPLLAESSLNLVFEPAEELASLFTDEQKVSQILRNFISNGIKFTPRGEVRVSARQQGPYVEFLVADTGIGIASCDRLIIFEEFAQIDSSIQKRVKGTGLGLPLSRRLAELLGGSVDVESTVDVGSTFYLRIPPVYAGAAISGDLKGIEIEPGRKLILIVEDNPETAFVYSRYLENAGFQSHTVATVADAKRVLVTVTPAAIMLDVMLRSETTWDFLRELKEQPNSIPVLMMSVSDDERKMFGLGADAHLTKPFVPERMIDEVVRLTSPRVRPRILLIDDNEVSRYLLRGHMPDSEYEVFEARDGREGIRVAGTVLPDLIFLDFYMPGLNGAEVMRDLRNSAELNSTAIVLHSTKVLDASEAQLFQQKAVAIFPKQSLTLPDSGERLRQLIGTLISNARAQTQSA